MPKERNKADDYREKAYNPFAYAASPLGGDAQRYELAANGGDAQAQFATGWFLMTGTGVPKEIKDLSHDCEPRKNSIQQQPLPQSLPTRPSAES